MHPKLKLIRSGKDVTMNSLLLEHRKHRKSQLERKASNKKNGSKRHLKTESVDLGHTMMSVMTALQDLNQRNLNGLEIVEGEWEELGDLVTKLNELLIVKNGNDS